MAAELKTLEVILSASCNMACGYCYQNAKQARRMEWRTLRAALDRLLASPEPAVNVVFIGGEPLLELPLIRRAVAHVDERRARGQEVGFTLSTNGLLLDRAATRFLARNRFDVQLSFDGVPAAQDLRGKGTYEVLDRLLDRLRVEEPGFFNGHFTVAITLVVQAIPHLAESVEYFFAKRVPEIAIDVAVVDDSWCEDSRAGLESQFERIFELSVRHYERTGQVPVQLFRRSREASHHRPTRRSLCGVGSGEAIAVDVDGEVNGCVTFARSYQRLPEFLESRLAPMRMGPIDAEEFAERHASYPRAARAAQIFDDKQDKYSSYGRCGECRHLLECTICPMTIGQLPGNTDPNRIPDFACAFNLISLDCKKRFPRQPTAEEVLLGRAPVPEWMRALELAAQPGSAGKS